MYSQRDLLQAYRFNLGRLVSALVRGEPDLQQTPMRRGVTGTVWGVLVAVLVVVGFGVYGLVVPGGNRAWQEPGAIIVEKETGNRYLFLDGTLRPVLNFASAKLGTEPDSRVRSVSRASLSGTPHGQPIGIPDAPNVLPQQGKLASSGWLVCASTVDQPSSTERKPGIAVAIGEVWPGEPIGEDAGAVVRGSNGVLYLVWRDVRFRIRDQAVLTALGYGSAQPMDVDSAWFNAFDLGPDLVAPEIPQRGAVGPAVDGRPSRVGQLFESRSANGGKDLFVLRADGLSPVSATDQALLLADPRGGLSTAEPVQLSPAAAARAKRSATSTVTQRFPPSPPALVPALSTGDKARNRALCAQLTFTADKAPATRLVTANRDKVDAAARTATALGGPDGGPDTRLADQIKVEPDAGMVARALAGPGISTGTRYLVTDTGVRYPVANDEAMQLLGYAGTPPVSVPTGLLAFLPTGPTLDPEQARVERARQR
jgi:type VII secretion protein EccB